MEWRWANDFILICMWPLSFGTRMEKIYCKTKSSRPPICRNGKYNLSGKRCDKSKKISSGININLIVPNESQAILNVPKKYQKVYINGEISISKNADSLNNLITLSGGNYKILYSRN